jgi:hypothetical protein
MVTPDEAPVLVHRRARVPEGVPCNARQHSCDVYGWLSRPYAETPDGWLESPSQTSLCGLGVAKGALLAKEASQSPSRHGVRQAMASCAEGVLWHWTVCRLVSRVRRPARGEMVSRAALDKTARLRTAAGSAMPPKASEAGRVLGHTRHPRACLISASRSLAESTTCRRTARSAHRSGSTRTSPCRNWSAPSSPLCLAAPSGRSRRPPSRRCSS